MKLFKSVASLLNTCLTIIIEREKNINTQTSEMIYVLKYKPISVILKIFSRIILSNIVNLSILDSYADPDLIAFLNNIFHIIISLPTEAITSYMKVVWIFFILFLSHGFLFIREWKTFMKLWKFFQRNTSSSFSNFHRRLLEKF